MLFDFLSFLRSGAWGPASSALRFLRDGSMSESTSADTEVKHPEATVVGACLAECGCSTFRAGSSGWTVTAVVAGGLFGDGAFASWSLAVVSVGVCETL